ncbi:MAG TPA: DUF1588 domain-containing protein [Polyangiaceae bacterium]|jgi:hypothetical protein|nr:DUF1588 domain-containing protein [Polyangiaceae bacterium]
MGALRDLGFLLALPLGIAAVACQGNLAGAGGRNGASSGSGSASGVGSGGSAALPPGTSTMSLLPASIRRLTNLEYENSVRDVVGNTDPVTTDFVPDARQSGFTVNEAQIVDSVLIKQLAGAAATLAADVRANLDTAAPCADQTAGAEDCAKSFIQSFATRAFRRPLGDDEAARLLTLYHAAADGATYADGIEEVASGVLQSAAFLYLTATGGGASGTNVELTPYEIASQMSYLLRASPPSQDLIAAAVAGKLDTSDGRAQAIQDYGLLGGADPLNRTVRIIREWLGTDQLEDTAKDTTVYPDFPGLKPAMVAETTDFLNDVVTRRDKGYGTLQELLGANWTSTKDPNLAALYDAAGPGTDADDTITLPKRIGILNQGAFLSVYAHANETAPVLRGVAILRRVTCIGVPSPATLNITVVPLVPDPTKSMRDRLGAHVSDPVCATCHTQIDNIGFTFELYDGMGKDHFTDVNMAPINSAATISQTKSDLDNQTFADSNALATALSTDPMVRECFARNIFRASSGRSDDTSQSSEDDFVKYWHTQDDSLPEAQKAGIINTIMDYIKSPTFTLRRTQ